MYVTNIFDNIYNNVKCYPSISCGSTNRPPAPAVCRIFFARYVLLLKFNGKILYYFLNAGVFSAGGWCTLTASTHLTATGLLGHRMDRTYKTLHMSRLRAIRVCWVAMVISLNQWFIIKDFSSESLVRSRYGEVPWGDQSITFF